MRRWFATCVGVVLLASFVGCGSESQNKTADPKEHLARVDAAAQISNSAQRDDALAKASVEAAEAGAEEAVKRGIKSINNSSKRDDAAATSALKLTAAGKTEHAIEVAKSINNTSKRDETLKKIATGSN